MGNGASCLFTQNHRSTVSPTLCPSGGITVLVSRFEFERIDLAITSPLANWPVASESKSARDQCHSAAVTPPVNLGFRSGLASADI